MFPAPWSMAITGPWLAMGVAAISFSYRWIVATAFCPPLAPFLGREAASLIIQNSWSSAPPAGSIASSSSINLPEETASS